MFAQRWRRRWVPLAVLALGLASTTAACLQIAHVQRSREHERFERAVEVTRDEISRRMDSYVTLLRASAGLFAASEQVTLAEFRRFVDCLKLDDTFPGIQGVGLSIRGGPDGRESLARRLRETYADEFALYPATDSPEEHAIIFLEPLDMMNRRAIGYNMFAEPTRRAAMELARDSASPVASGLVTLVQEFNNQPQKGFLIYVPLYGTPDAPADIEQRRQTLVGFVYAPFRTRDLLHAIVNQANFNVEFTLHDAADRPRPDAIFISTDFDRAAAATDFQRTASISVAGRTWMASIVPGADFAAGAPTDLVPLVASAGTLISLLLFAVVGVQTRAAERFELAANVLRTSERRLIESEARKSAILESAPDAIITIDHAGRVIEWNPAAERMFRWNHESAVGRALDELIIPVTARQEHRAGLRRALAPRPPGTPGRRFETVAVRADGSEFPVEISVACIADATPPRYTGFIRDITERAHAEHHRQLMNRELDHRVKNNLSTVMAILSESARRAPSTDSLVRSVTGRLRALAGLHEMLAARKWQGAELSQLVARTLAPHAPDPANPDAPTAPSRVTVTGPAVQIPGRVASALCMALHELATNASKYGSLSVAHGSVHISWSLQRRDHEPDDLVVVWREADGPPVHPPAQRGFGSELIHGGIAFETGGRSIIEFAPDGVVCTIRIPLRPSEPPQTTSDTRAQPPPTRSPPAA